MYQPDSHFDNMKPTGYSLYYPYFERYLEMCHGLQNSYSRDQRYITPMIKIQLNLSSSCQTTAVWLENF